MGRFMADPAHPLDEFDRNILRELQRDGRRTNADLARAVHLSESACLRRLKALEANGTIEGYSAKVSPSAVAMRAVVKRSGLPL
eukprot:gene14380-14503_t